MQTKYIVLDREFDTEAVALAYNELPTVYVVKQSVFSDRELANQYASSQYGVPVTALADQVIETKLQ